MKTLYDLLGVDHRASVTVIKHCYQSHLAAHISEHGSRQLDKREQARLQAMRKAYLVLSSSTLRGAYDNRLLKRQKKRERLIRVLCFVLGAMLLAVGLLLAGAGFYYAMQKDKTRLNSESMPIGDETLHAQRLVSVQHAQAKKGGIKHD